MSFELRNKHPIPVIDSGLLRTQVFTHKSAIGAPAKVAVDSEPALDNERLALLGDAVITLMVTATVECNKPLSRVGDLDDKRKLLISRERLSSWAEAYDLPSQLRTNSSQQFVIRQNESAKSQLFQAYVGALYKEQGLYLIEEWFRPVLDDALNEITEHESLYGMPDDKSWTNNTSPSTSRTEPVLPIACPPRAGEPRPAAEPPAGKTGAGTLSFFNEKYSQRMRGAQVPWVVTSTGPPHAPEFTATLTFPGEVDPVGIGIGTTKLLAKQQAAAVALETLEWT